MKIHSDILPSFNGIQEQFEIKKIEANRHYQLRFMPNYYTKSCCIDGTIVCPGCDGRIIEDHLFCARCHGTGRVTCGKCNGNPSLENHIEPLTISFDNGEPNTSKRIFAYVIENGKIEIYLFSISIINMLQACVKGYYGTPGGYYITDDDAILEERNRTMGFTFKKFYASENFDYITISESLGRGLKEHRLYETNPPRFPMNISKGLHLEFDTVMTQGFIRVCAPRWTEDKYKSKSELPTEILTKLYDGVPTLQAAKKQYIDELGKSGKYLFDMDAIAYNKRMWQRKKQLMNG